MNDDTSTVLSRRGLLGGATVAGAALLGTALAEPAHAAPQGARRPRMLRPGDRVRLVSPGSAPNRDLVARGTELLSSWGLVVELAPHALEKFGYLSAPDADRLADLNAALADPSVRGVIATRGGYGTQRVVDGMDLAAVRRDPKIVAGFSDITALQSALWRATRLATVHGPMAAWNDARTGPESAESLRSALMTAEPRTLIRDPAETSAPVEVPGRASGVLLGGNLTMLAATLGVRDFPSLRGAVLFFEEVGEAPYRVDRMLTQLRRSGALRGLAGVALGQFVDCVGRPDEWDVVQVLRDRLADLGVPVLGGLRLGHGPGQLTIPLGVPATIDTTSGTLTVQPGVVG